ncbi:MAG: alpha-E domain-containing protein [Pirellulaceae bacterium]|nr:alpha-E domain-containing protein [Planctomycetales bacterium]
MLSRVADSVYWMSRYIERADNVARFIDVNHNLTLGAAQGLDEQWEPLIHTTGDHELFADRYDTPSRDSVVRFLTFDRENPNSILSCFERARENARTIREAITSPMWEELNKFYHSVRRAAESGTIVEQLHDFCDRVRLASHLLAGVTDDTMSHTEAWHFSRIGRLVERADKTSRIVDVQYYILLPNASDVGTSLDVIRWSALLKSASALEMYRRTHGKIVPNNVADFLILNRNFPRSIHFCLIRSHESIREITGSAVGTFMNRAEQRLGRLRTEMDYTGIKDIIDFGLHEYIDTFQQRLNQVGDAVYQDFFVQNVQ